jgi:2',3'-cyclic-nucleotide 2'-phosphodiesterase (5'-nucleotidase family)
MEPSPDGGLGGVARRAAYFKSRAAERPLILDVGDAFQGSPYFSWFNGEVEMAAMSKMGYRAMAVGNHDFDASLDTLLKQSARHAPEMQLLCSNLRHPSSHPSAPDSNQTAAAAAAAAAGGGGGGGGGGGAGTNAAGYPFKRFHLFEAEATRSTPKAEGGVVGDGSRLSAEEETKVVRVGVVALMGEEAWSCVQTELRSGLILQDPLQAAVACCDELLAMGADVLVCYI